MCLFFSIFVLLCFLREEKSDQIFMEILEDITLCL